MSNVYTIAIRMTMHDNASAGLMQLAAHLTGIHHHLGLATAALGRFRMAVGGALAAGAGIGIFKGIGHMIDEGAHLQKVQNQMIAAGWKNKEIAEATAEAWRLSSKYQALGVAELMEMQKEMAPVLGDRKEAMHMAETMSKLSMAMLGTFGTESTAKFNKQIRDAIRAGELSGNVLQPERFEKYLDGMAKTLKAFGGTITPTDYFQATKYGRASAFNWSDEFTNEILPTIMQELGASSTGTALMTMYGAAIGGRMSLRSISMFDKLGMINRDKLDPENLTPEGKIKRMSPGAMVGHDTLMTNPYEWVQSTLLPAMLKNKKITQEGLDEINKGNIKEGLGEKTRKEITALMAILFGDRTAQGMADLFALQRKKIERDRKLRGDAMGLDVGAQFYNEKDYGVAKKGFETQWKNLMQALGGPGVDTATKALHAMNGALSSMGNFAQANPEGVKIAMVALGSLAAALVVIGTAAVGLAVLGGGGVIAVAVGAIAAFVAAMAALNWDKIKGFTADIGTKFADFHIQAGLAIIEVGNKISAAITAIPGQVAGAITAAFGSIASMITGAVSGIGASIGAAVGRLNPFGGGKSVPGAAPSVQPQSFVPPAGGGKTIQAHTTINLDGRKVAQSVAHHIAQGSQQVYSAAGFDGRMAATTPDYQAI